MRGGVDGPHISMAHLSVEWAAFLATSDAVISRANRLINEVFCHSSTAGDSRSMPRLKRFPQWKNYHADGDLVTRDASIEKTGIFMQAPNPVELGSMIECAHSRWRNLRRYRAPAYSMEILLIMPRT
jgi:hypothetical protein